MEDVKYCRRHNRRRRRHNSRTLESPNCDKRGNDDLYCDKLSFRVASALLGRFDGGRHERTGLDILRGLAEGGYPDAMVYYGMCLNEGRDGSGNDDNNDDDDDDDEDSLPDSAAAVSWFRRSAELHDHPRGMYELGVAYYTGGGGDRRRA